MIGVKIILHQLFNGQRRSYRYRLAMHKAPHRFSLQHLPGQKLLIRHFGGILQKETDQDPPDPADEITLDNLYKAQAD